jgi:hypothetical protein
VDEVLTLGVTRKVLDQIVGQATILESQQLARDPLPIVSIEYEFKRALRIPEIRTNPEGMLYCSDCGYWLADEKFPVDRSRKSRRGRAYECSDCRKEYGAWLYRERRTKRSQVHKPRKIA